MAGAARPGLAPAGPSPTADWCATTPTTRCPAGSPRRSPCSTRRARASCCPRSTTATRRACTPSRCARGRPSSSSRPRRPRRCGWPWPARCRKRRVEGRRPVALPEHPVRVKIAFLGPPGTFSEEALRAARAGDFEPVPLPTVYEAVMAVHDGGGEQALVPIENSLEGSGNATPHAPALETRDVAIVGETVPPVRHCLIAARHLELDEIETVVSHPQANAQCARFIRERLGGAQVLAAASTAEAVRVVASEAARPWAALGTRLAAELYGCEILRGGVEDVADNETRFVWLARAGMSEAASPGPWKTSLVFWGVGAQEPGWLVRCLSEFAFRGVNLTKIESRPRKQGLGRYMFFADLEGRADDGPVAEAIRGLQAHCEEVRALGTYPAA